MNRWCLPPSHLVAGRVHAIAVKNAGDKDISVLNKLINYYGKTSTTISDAFCLFNDIKFPNIATWTSIISATSTTATSILLFLSMLRHPTLPNERTIASLLKTCASLKCFSTGYQLHALSAKLSFYHLPYCGSALISMYSKCGLLSDARKIFEKMPERDEVCYGAIIVGLAQNGRSEEALSIFADMRSEGVSSTMYSVSGALCATAASASLERCRILHCHSILVGLESNLVVGTALLDGYGKSGLVLDARKTFVEIREVANIVAWNSMMSAYAQQGDLNSIQQLFDEMPRQGIVADEFSFLAILSACSNAGLVQEAKDWIKLMEVKYRLFPEMEHYTCMVGAMARAGMLKEAESFINKMPFNPDAAVWRTLLSGCVAHGATEIGNMAARRLLEHDPQDDSAFVILANIYAAKRDWCQMAQVRTEMRNRGVKKEGGKSWIEVRGVVHVFIAGDKRHEQTTEIYAKLAQLMEEISKLGYVEVSELGVRDNEGIENRESLRYHSEKLAVAFGLVSGATPPGKTLRIVKNLRICRDCHEAFKFMNVVIEREIVVRDVNRYHRFENGVCSCKDFW